MATFSYTPDFGAEKSVESNVEETEFGDGYSQRQAKGINANRQVWKLTFNNRSTADADAIDAFLTARGGYESFDWTPPGGSAGKYICRSGQWTKKRIKANLYSLTATFRQVFEP